MDKQKNSWSGNPATNQGESSNIDPTIKVGTLIPPVQNQQGVESGQSVTAGLGAPTGQVSTGVDYSIKDTTTFNDEAPPQINITASTEDRSKKWQNREQDIPEAGRNQYQS